MRSVKTRGGEETRCKKTKPFTYVWSLHKCEKKGAIVKRSLRNFSL